MSEPRVRYVADALVTCDEAMTLHVPGALDVSAGRIEWVGVPDDAPPHAVEEKRLSGLLMPGLVDVHCHSPMTLFRGAAEDVPLDRFLREILWPREARLTDDDVYWGMTLAGAELLRGGVTTTCEMYFFDEAIVRAALTSGLRCVVTAALIDAPGWDHLGGWEKRLE